MRAISVLMSFIILFTFSACIKANPSEEVIVHIQVNGLPITMADSPPYIDTRSNRTMVPIRFVAEYLGGTVSWDADKQQVLIQKDGIKMELTIGRTEAMVNGKKIGLDTSPLIKHNRTYVPVRFVSESLQATVGWDSATSTIIIHSHALPKKETVSDQGIYGVYIGQHAQQVVEMHGSPARKEPSSLGYEWWVYNQNLESYMQIGVKEGKVVDVYSPSKSWRFKGIQVGSTKQQLLSQFTFQPTLQFQYDGATFSLENQSKERPVFLDGEPIIVYLDVHDGEKVTAIRLIEKEYLVKSQNYALKWSYSGQAPHVKANPITLEEEQRVKKGLEAQVLDLVNVSRQREGLPIVVWNEHAAAVARKHSLDMLTQNYFDHVSKAGLSPFDRLNQGGVKFRTAGENIAAGYHDAIEVHHGWMNSIGHRKNILHKDFKTLGVGVEGDYYTQNFVTP
ncbi:stalk domain-containing protein [Ammoniphilus sp. YIM 78166]|uniref:stalk domain-containing protein n=1 Tax=Ammoniphilus sp. YIM 78166 TaxID=1644106 RepID=UPI0010701B72|nr:stalk domain-containing protein [Ammoniphilus sp. YIM 78166]